MFDIAQLLPLLQSQMQQKEGQNTQNPLANIDFGSLISGGGFGGGQTQGPLGGLLGKSKGGLLDNLFKTGGGGASKGLGGIFSKGGLGLAKGSTGGLFSGGMSGAGSAGAAGLYSVAGDVLGGLVSKNNTNKYGIIDDKSARGAGALKGAGKGAAIGSIIPGLGTAVGAGIGAIAGGLFSKGNEDEVLKAYRDPAIETLDGNINKASQRSGYTNSLFDFDGTETTGYAKYGGYITPKLGTGGTTPTKGKKEKSAPRNLTEKEKLRLTEELASQNTFSENAANYDPYNNGGIFATQDTMQSEYPTLDLGKYKGKGYFDVQTDSEGRYTVHNTKSNPANAYLHKQQLNNLRAINPDANIMGNSSSGFTPLLKLALGGNVAPEYQVEGGEVMYAPEDNPPQTDGNGNAEKIGPNMFKFNGDKHSAPSGGIGVQGGNTPFIGNTGEVEPTGFVFSEKLKTDASKYLKGL